MLKRALRSIRQKPKAVRDQYAFWIAAVFTGIVALVWVNSKFESVTPVASVAPEVVPESDQQQPESLSDIVNELQAEIGNVRSTVQSTTTAITTPRAETPTSTLSTAPQFNTQSEIRIATFTTSVASTTP